MLSLSWMQCLHCPVWLFPVSGSVKHVSLLKDLPTKAAKEDHEIKATFVILKQQIVIWILQTSVMIIWRKRERTRERKIFFPSVSGEVPFSENCFTLNQFTYIPVTKICFVFFYVLLRTVDVNWRASFWSEGWILNCIRPISRARPIVERSIELIQDWGQFWIQVRRPL